MITFTKLCFFFDIFSTVCPGVNITWLSVLHYLLSYDCLWISNKYLREGIEGLAIVFLKCRHLHKIINQINWFECKRHLQRWPGAGGANSREIPFTTCTKNDDDIRLPVCTIFLCHWNSKKHLNTMTNMFNLHTF